MLFAMNTRVFVCLRRGAVAWTSVRVSVIVGMLFCVAEGDTAECQWMGLGKEATVKYPCPSYVPPDPLLSPAALPYFIIALRNNQSPKLFSSPDAW